MSKVFLSVVIPLYNKSYSIERCLLSILKQTILPDEIVIINDGSTDDSFNVAHRLAESFSSHSTKIVLKSQVNQGVSVARNNGIKYASSTYVALIDADDEWRPKFLEKMTELISIFPNQPLYTCRHQVNDPIVGVYSPLQKMDDDFGLIEDYHALAAMGSVANSSKVVINKKHFDKIGGFPVGEKVSEDLYVWSMLSSLGEVAYCGYYGSIIHQVPDASRAVRNNSTPYIIRYYSQNKGELSVSLKKYLWIVHKNHLLESILKNNRSEFLERWRIGNLIFDNGNHPLLFMYLLPSFLCTRVRYMKRRLLKKRWLN